MRIEDLDFDYPELLVATERSPKSRIMWVEGGQPSEIAGISDLISHDRRSFQPGDLLVVNNTRVLKRRVFTESGLEILFIDSNSDLTQWEVLCPASRWKSGAEQVLPGGVKLRLIARGKPQKVEADEPLNEAYFERHGEMPLPPYIQKARGERHNRADDSARYQTQWAERDGSLAAPTASLHFSKEDLELLKTRGVRVAEVTLHVGLGTFLPVSAENLEDHVMHAELSEVSSSTWNLIESAKADGKNIWALGTTVTRTLESVALGRLPKMADGSYRGETDLFIRPGFQFQVVDRLLTNFHQPRSTLLALVAAFAGLEVVRRSYKWAIEREFRLFSYGDLTVWIK